MRISVQMMSGLTVELLLAKDSTIADVKGKLHRQWNIKADQQILLCPVESRPLEDEERVISLVDWFVMEDIVDPFLMKTLYFEVVWGLSWSHMGMHRTYTGDAHDMHRRCTGHALGDGVILGSCWG